MKRGGAANIYCSLFLFLGLNGALVTQLNGNFQLDHPTQKAFSHIIILLKIFIQVTGRYTPLKI